MIEGVGGIVREITGTVIFGVCKVKGKNVERWPTYVLDYIKETKEEDIPMMRMERKREYTHEDIQTRMMNGDDDYRSMIPCRSNSVRLQGKNYTPAKKQEKKIA